MIVEASEMAGITRAERESLKAFLSRTDDGSIRLAWRKNPETMLRRCVFVGSTNDRNFLPNDPTGNRRFVVVNVGGTERGAAGVRTYLETYREQLWAEAIHLYMIGIPAHLTENLKGLQSEANEQHRRRDDILEDTLDSWLENAPRRFKLEQAARGVGLIENGERRALADARSSAAWASPDGSGLRQAATDNRRRSWLLLEQVSSQELVALTNAAPLRPFVSLCTTKRIFRW